MDAPVVIRVLVAEDQHMIRAALVALLELHVDISVVAQAEAGDEVLDTVRQSRPDVAVIDIGLPGIDGLTAAEAVRRSVPECGILILTSFDRASHVRRALDAGVAGFMLKDARPDDLARAIRTIAAGGRVIDPELAAMAWKIERCPLTPRELEVLRYAAAGHDVPAVAERVFLGVGTVRNYLTSAVTKLNARNRVDAIRIAQDAGWL